jgi:1-acyl-sn-glycerol-3-phosphate acyltransferase
MRWLSRIIFFKILRWDLKGAIDPDLKKCVVIVAPHTSWYDFFIGVLVRKIIGLKINFVAKRELFKTPFGWYFKWVGGSALDRTPNQNKVEAIVKIFKTEEIFRLALSPEGTRKKTDRWKTGFYYIARAANVPVVRVAIDFSKKVVLISKPYYTTVNSQKDLEEILRFYNGVKGKVPENF